MTRTVLIVEDNDLNRRLYALVLGRAGFRVIEAGDGVEGLRMVREHRPALVILDMELPELTGIDMVRAIRADSEIAAQPVLIVTAIVSPRLTDMARTLGCSGTLHKPVRPRDLVAQARRALDQPFVTA